MRASIVPGSGVAVSFLPPKPPSPPKPLSLSLVFLSTAVWPVNKHTSVLVLLGGLARDRRAYVRVRCVRKPQHPRAFVALKYGGIITLFSTLGYVCVVVFARREERSRFVILLSRAPLRRRVHTKRE